MVGMVGLEEALLEQIVTTAAGVFLGVGVFYFLILGLERWDENRKRRGQEAAFVRDQWHKGLTPEDRVRGRR